jgi:hypothetical protein
MEPTQWMASTLSARVEEIEFVKTVLGLEEKLVWAENVDCGPHDEAIKVA